MVEARGQTSWLHGGGGQDRRRGGRGRRSVVAGQLVSSGAVAPICSLAVAPPAAGPTRETQALALHTLGLFGECDHASLSASILDYPSLVTVLVGNLDPSRPSELR